MAGPWMARDAYVAETAVTLDRLVAKIERLEQREEALNARIQELMEHAQQANRLQALAESLRNSRDYKLGELTRQFKDMRSRVEAIEGPRASQGSLVFKTLVDIDRRLQELSVRETRQASLRGWRRPALVPVCLAVVAAVVLLAGHAF